MSGHAEPEVHENKKVNSGCQECALKAKAQCEMKELELKVSYRCFQWAEPPKGSAPHKAPDLLSPIETRLKTHKIRRHEVLSKKDQSALGKDMVALLKNYDLIIDSLASFRTRDSAPETFCEIEVKAEGEGKCAHEQHVVISMQPKSETSGISAGFHPAPIKGEEHMVLRPAIWKPEVTEVTIKELLAPTYNADLGAGDNVFGKLFQLLMFVFHANRSADIEFVATTCGKHSATENGPKELTALVRVFRDLSIGVGFKCPPPIRCSEEIKGSLGVLSGSRELEYKLEAADRQHRVEVEAKASRETHREGKHVVTETESEAKIAFKREPEDGYALYFKFNELEFNLSEKSEDVKQIGEANEKAHKAVEAGHQKVSDSLASLKAWANKPSGPKRKMNFAEMERMAKNIRGQLQAFFSDFVSKVKAIKDLLYTLPRLMKKWPQLGFKLETEIGFLGGDIFAAWGMVNVDSDKAQNTPVHDRYAPLFPKIHLETKVSLVKFKLAGSFGAMIDGGWVGSAKARVEVVLTLEVSWQTWLEVVFNLNGNDLDRYVQSLTETTKGEISAEVEAKALGITLVQKKIGIESGIAVEGILIWELSNGKLSYQVNVRTLETGWYYYTNDIKTGRAHTSVHQIFAPQLVHHSEGLIRG